MKQLIEILINTKAMFYKCDAHLQDDVPTWRLSRDRRAASHKETRASRTAGALSRNEAPTLVATSSSYSRSAENINKTSKFSQGTGNATR